MAYDDYKINPQEFEGLAREFSSKIKVKQQNTEQDGEETQISQKDLDIVDIIIGFKILERLFMFGKDRSRNPRLLHFIEDNLPNVEEIERSLSQISGNVSANEIDFEYPENDHKTIKMMQNIISSQILNLSNLMQFFEVPEHRELIVKIIAKLASLIKDIFNLED